MNYEIPSELRSGVEDLVERALSSEASPKIAKDAFVSDEANICGRVSIGARCCILAGTQIRGDTQPIVIGDETCVQENCILHVGFQDKDAVNIGRHTAIGHGCILHGCDIGDNSLIGMGSIVMNHTTIGNNCLIGAGSLVTNGTVIPDCSLAFGRPARVVRTLSENEIETLVTIAAEEYIALGPHLERAGILRRF